MKITRARITPFRLRLRAPLATAHGAIAQREGWLVELCAADGTTGVGEASPLPGFGLESHAEAGRALATAAAALLGSSPGDTPSCLPEPKVAPPAARAAVDTALHDLAARRAGLPLAEWLARAAGRAALRHVTLCALLSAATPAGAAAEARRRAREGFTTLKLKLGADDFEADLARVAAVREAVGPGVALRLDANGAWKAADAAGRCGALAPHGIELLEQPVPAQDVDALARLRAHAPFPIAADEAVRDLDAAARLLAAGAADVLVVKPAALGGLRVASRVAALACSAGVPVLVTSFLDSAVGRASALQLAASLPEGPAAGLATAGLLADDLAAGPSVRRGVLDVSRAPGLGVDVDPDALADAATGDSLELAA